MGTDRELLELIRQLKLSTSLHEQLRLVVRSWRIVKSLSPAERNELAKHIGFAEAETLLDSLGKPHGLAPTRLLKAIQSAEKSDFREWRDLVQDLRSPEKRVKGLRKSADLLQDLVIEVTDDGEEGPSAEAVPQPDASAAPKAVPPPPPVLPPPARIEPSPAPSTPVRPPEEPLRAAGPREAPLQQEQPETPPKEVPAGETAPVAKSRSEEKSPVPVKPLEKATVPKPPAPGTTGAVAPLPASPDTGLLRRLSQEPSLIKRFRLLRQPASSTLDQEQVAAILQLFPENWTRRKVLSLLISAGYLRETKDLSAALDLLPDPEDEVWCISTWLRGSWAADKAALTEMEEQVRSDRSRRLIQKVLHRS